jgi:hypothetical protein
MEMFSAEDAETEMLAKPAKLIVHCFLEPNVKQGIPAVEAMGISVY